MEIKGGKKKSSSNSSLQYEAPLGYSIEDVRPHGGIQKFRSAAYSNVRILNQSHSYIIIIQNHIFLSFSFTITERILIVVVFSLFCSA